MCTLSGMLYLVDDGRIIIRESPYIDKFGESVKNSSKNWAEFTISSGLGAKVMMELEKAYVENRISDEIIRERVSNDNIVRYSIL